MRYPASEKLEIIRLVEESTLPVRRTLGKMSPCLSNHHNAVALLHREPRPSLARRDVERNVE
jgi:hypothetical protein